MKNEGGGVCMAVVIRLWRKAAVGRIAVPSETTGNLTLFKPGQVGMEKRGWSQWISHDYTSNGYKPMTTSSTARGT
jgi:hypothetical protein